TPALPHYPPIPARRSHAGPNTPAHRAPPREGEIPYDDLKVLPKTWVPMRMLAMRFGVNSRTLNQWIYEANPPRAPMPHEEQYKSPGNQRVKAAWDPGQQLLFLMSLHAWRSARQAIGQDPDYDPQPVSDEMARI